MRKKKELPNRWEGFTPELIQARQLSSLNGLLEVTIRNNSFYKEHLGELQLPLKSFAQLQELPLLQKNDISVLDIRGLPPHHTWPESAYTRWHRTSGTRGRPLPILDTREDWQWWVNTWQYVLDAAEITAEDRAIMAFSFGPFIGFWSGYEALAARGTLLIPAGGMSSSARLQLACDCEATVLCCTPTYALRLASVAEKEGRDLTKLKICKIVVAGEPGGSIPIIRQRIESVWNAKLTDHAGATEIGPWGFGSRCGTGLHVIENEFIAEIINPVTLQPIADGAIGELVLTNLGRTGSPVIRYRTGDQVRGVRKHNLPCPFLFLDGGVIGRTDDMAVVRGVNIFPSSIEAIVREFPEIGEFQVILKRENELDEMEVRFESGRSDCLQSLADAFVARLGLRIPVVQVAVGKLPESDGKSRRLLDLR